MRLALLAVAALSLFVAACGGAENKPDLAEAGSRTTGGGTSCAKGEGAPISTTLALETLRSNGISVRRDRLLCDAEVVAALSNHEARGDVLGIDGLVSCHIRGRLSADAPSTVVRRGADGADAQLSLANVECAILADSPRGEVKIDRLERAFNQLKRAIQP
jgi:hypothetical protein